MSVPERPSPLRNIVPAATGFSLTFVAGMAATVFFLTGGFPDYGADRPAIGWENAAVSAEPTQLATANPLPPAAPPEPVVKRKSRDETPVDPKPSGRDAAAPARFNVQLDIESLDSILADGEAMDAVDNSRRAYDEEPLRRGAIPPEAVENSQTAPESEPPPEMWGWEAR